MCMGSCEMYICISGVPVDHLVPGCNCHYNSTPSGILPPTVYTPAQALEMANGSVWAFDQLPTRLQILRKLLLSDQPRSAAIYVHCSAGCDRTGEAIGRCVYVCIMHVGCVSVGV